MDFLIIKEIGSYAGAVVTIVGLLTLIIKPLREKFADWINKTSDRDGINSKIDRLTALMETTVSQNDELQAEMLKQSKALQANLRNSILNLYNKCISRNYITTYELQNLSQLYENYKTLGGNSFIQDCVDRLKGLEVKND